MDYCSQAAQESFQRVASTSHTLDDYVVVHSQDWIHEARFLTTIWASMFADALHEFYKSLDEKELANFYAAIEQNITSKEQNVKDIWGTGFIEQVCVHAYRDHEFREHILIKLGTESLTYIDTWNDLNGVNWHTATRETKL